MPTLSGTLRFWSGDEAPTEVRRVRFGEFDGVSRGLTIKVDTLVLAMAPGWGG